MDRKIDIILSAKNMTMSGIARAKAGFAALGADVKKVWAGITSYFRTASIAAGAVIGVIGLVAKKTIEAHRTQAASEAKLAAVLKTTGYAAGFTTGQLKKYSAELQKSIGSADETTLSMMGLLATFRNIKGDNFKRATVAIIDMGAAMSKVGKGSADIEAQAIQVGKALNDPIAGISALGRVGVQFTKAQKDQIKVLQESGDLFAAQAIILQELEKEFSGTAKAIFESSSGVIRLKNSWGDFKEEIGRVILETASLESQFNDLSTTMDGIVERGTVELWAEDSGKAVKKLTWITKNYSKALLFASDLISKMPTLKAARAITDVITGEQGDPDRDRKNRLAAIRLRKTKREMEQELDDIMGMEQGQRTAKAEEAAKKEADLEKWAAESKMMSIMDYVNTAKNFMAEKLSAAGEYLKKEVELYDEAEQKKVDALNRVNDKILELKQQQIDEEKRLEVQGLEDQKDVITKRLEAAREMNQKTVQQIIDEAKQNKGARDQQEQEATRAEKLLAKQKRGIKISGRDANWLDAWNQQQNAGIAVDPLRKEQLALQGKIDTSNDRLREIKTELQNNNRILMGLLPMG